MSKLIDFKGLKAIVPIRMSSTRIKDKVLLPIHDKDGNKVPLYEWKIKQLQEVLPSDQIVVSASEEELIEGAKRLGVQVHVRKEALSRGHEATFSQVITGIVSEIEAEHIAWCTVVCPLMSPQNYRDGFTAYQERIGGEHDSLVAVNHLKEYFWYGDKPLNYTGDKQHVISQELDPVSRVTNGLYMISREDCLKYEYLLGANPFLFETPKLAGFDIDEMVDYQIATSLMWKYHMEN